VNLIVRLAG